MSIKSLHNPNRILPNIQNARSRNV